MKWNEKTKKWESPTYKCSKCNKEFGIFSDYTFHTTNKVCQK
uniref:C2H2-type domain-containing protein n=1 Tax=viral metagenome TaxID=1070528 RepID=A0A6C0J951_9ZZZZ